MKFEIERKFLVEEIDFLKEISDKKVVSIEQTYLSANKLEEVRLRKKVQFNSESFVLTVKKGKGLIREEIETNLSKETYEELISSTNYIPLRKNRISFTYEGYFFELDLYEDLDLITVEVEFDSEEDSFNFSIPQWISKELTEDESFKNKNLWKRIQKKIS